jgi:hypothetical protein
MEKIFEGKDAVDVKRQFDAWLSENPKIRVTQKHPIKTLAINVSSPIARFAKKGPASNSVIMRVDYEELN